MSIINEALKKTGQYIRENEIKNNPSTKTISPPSPLLIYILILLAGILVSKFIFSLLSQPQRHNLAYNKNQNQPKTTQAPSASVTLPVAQEAPLENNTPTKQNFVLNGIFFSNNDGYALVNNQIVRENDLVDSAKVVKITTNTVELDSGGKIINLSTNR